MKAFKKTLDGNTSPKVEIAGTSTSVRTSASLGPTASNMTEETDKLANSLKLRLNCFEQPKSDCIASRGCDPEKITYIDARNNEANPLEENPKNCSFTKAGNMFGDLKGMRNLTSTSTDKTQSTQIFVFGDTTKSASGSAINYSKDDSAKSSTFSPLLPVTCFPCNKTTTTGEYATSKVADRKDISFGQKPLIFGNSSSALDETTADEAQPISIFESKINGLPKGSLFGQKPPKFGNSSSMFGDPSHSIFDSAINNSKSGTVNTSIYSSSFLSFRGCPSNENTTADGCIFGSGETPATTTTHVATSLFERLSVTTTSGSANTGPFVDLFKTATAAIGFASLPAKASKDDKVTIAFAKGKEKPGPGNFIGLTDQNAFARFAKPLTGVNDAKSNQTDSCSSAENNFNDNNYDPHYEPVIALPAEIVITTGEEEETKLFGERATLLRWDNTSKEWKERGDVNMYIMRCHQLKSKLNAFLPYGKE